MADVASLSAQLPDNLAQLSQLDELLSTDPSNIELQSLRSDLFEVILLTVELQREAGETPSAEAIAIIQAGQATVKTTPAAPETSIFSPAAAASYAALPASAPTAAAPANPFLPNTNTAAQAGPINGIYPAGARVMAQYAKDGKYYVARIDRVDVGADEYTVTYLEYNQSATLSFDLVRPWISATPDQLKMVNTPVKALYPEDGLFYNASVEGPSGTRPGFYIVKFGQFGKKKKKVELPCSDMMINERFMDAKTLQLTSAASAGSKAAASLSEEMVVPEHLIVQPHDTDAIKQQKIKKLKKLKFEHKKAFEEQETNKRKNSWQDFKAGKLSGQPKKQKLLHAPGLAQLQKPSMFSTSDSLDAVVGVVGSGRGMTDHATMSKHIFTQQAAEENTQK